MILALYAAIAFSHLSYLFFDVKWLFFLSLVMTGNFIYIAHLKYEKLIDRIKKLEKGGAE